MGIFIVFNLGSQEHWCWEYWCINLYLNTCFKSLGCISRSGVAKTYDNSVQSLSHVRLFVTPWAAARQASLSITNSQSLLKLMSIELVMPSNHLNPVICFCSYLQSYPASVSFPTNQFFTSGGQSISVSALAPVLLLNIQGWFPLGLTLVAAQGILKSLLQHHSSKASLLKPSVFFVVQL